MSRQIKNVSMVECKFVNSNYDKLNDTVTCEISYTDGTKEKITKLTEINWNPIEAEAGFDSDHEYPIWYATKVDV